MTIVSLEGMNTDGARRGVEAVTDPTLCTSDIEFSYLRALLKGILHTLAPDCIKNKNTFIAYSPSILKRCMFDVPAHKYILMEYLVRAEFNSKEIR